MKKTILPVLLVIVVCAATVISRIGRTQTVDIPAGPADSVGTQVPPFPRGPYLSSVTRNSIVVSWTSSRASSSALQYGTTQQYGSTVTHPDAVSRHSFTLTGLSANSRYHYRAISGTDTSSDFVFFTAANPGDPFVFVAYGDTRTDHPAHEEVLKRMVPLSPRFVINSGDLVVSNTPGNWDEYFADICKVTNLGETTPFYSVVGNHENGAMYYEILFLPSDNPAGTEAYYSFDYGNLHCIALDSEIPYEAGSDQYTWLLNDLSGPLAKAAKFKIAFWHRAVYSSGQHGSDLDVRKALCPVMESNGVDIVFNGHDHTYERSQKMNGTTYIVTGGGGAPLYGFKSDNGWTAYKESVHHFCEVSVDRNTLTMRMIRSSDGAVRDSLRIAKTADGTRTNE